MITHFTHPFHLLEAANALAEYTCGGCKTDGRGRGYRCTTCDFILHDRCATCPETTTFFMHPNHSLTLLVPNTPDLIITCKVCDEPILGTFYGCCSFNTHPICTGIQETINCPPAHPHHAVVAVCYEGLTTCHACGEDCTNMRYRCPVGCDVDFHLECLYGDRVAASTINGTRGLFGGRGGQRRRKRDVIFAMLSVLGDTMELVSFGMNAFSFIQGMM